ncbi:MAG: ATP-binding protein [Planctomycetia bacterium]|nr:ATP-binding protein [Planctomycetia bacterium]
MINRDLGAIIRKRLGTNKAIILMGSRQTGKTTLLKLLFPESNQTLWLNGDELDVQRLFENISSTRLKAILAGKNILVLDEAQRIADIGLRLKLITDQIPDVQVIATGSSSFNLANQINEPLTGRKWEYKMFPLSFREMVRHHGLLEEKRMLPHRLVYGYYPEVVSHPEDAKDLLKQLSDSYLYKDILMWEKIKKPDRLLRLLQALAFQIGNQVSYQELGETCGIERKTAEAYLQLLEQTFIIFRLPSFNRNLRNELKSSRKIYFYDNGIRNALIANFSEMESRQDIGALWENWLVSQRIIRNHYQGLWANCWFWRTANQKEIDYLEEENGVLRGFEFKWNPNAKVRIPKIFKETYNAEITTIHQDNFEDFLM